MNSNAPRWRRLLAWMRRHPWRMMFLFVLVGFLFLNLVAYLHARSMLFLTSGTERTPPPLSLSFAGKLRALFCGVSMPRLVNSRTPQELGLSAATLQFAAQDGLHLEGWLLKPPNAKGTVVLFHGYAGCRAALLEQGQAFYEMGYAALLVDFRGSGGSEGTFTSLGYHEAKDVAAAMECIRSRGLPRPHILYGQSMGGAAVLRSVACEGVCPDALILEAVFDRMLTTVRNRFAAMGLPSFPAAQLLVFWGGMQTGIPGFAHNPVEYAISCTCPTLLLHGAQDQYATPAECQAIFDTLQD